MKTAFHERIALQGCRMSALGFALLFIQVRAVADSPGGGLIVLPAEVMPLAVTIGEIQSVPDITLTVQNPGAGALRWTVSVDADLIELSANGGVLLPGEPQATVSILHREGFPLLCRRVACIGSSKLRCCVQWKRPG